MEPTTILRLTGDVQIVVPDSLDLITTYVLYEQEDWFEDETRFLRRLLGPGHRAIDIGANYGVYTLQMASIAGNAGQVWSFEPASKTAAMLAESIAVNRFDNVVLETLALSSKSGSAELSLHENSELNALVHGDGHAGSTEAVQVTTLDEYTELHNVQDIDFLKLDAEGEESRILEGGSRFFETQSPLVQYEVKAGETFHLELVSAFAGIGYTSYRLVPGLNVLIPFDDNEQVDDYLLNLYCCKPDRAARLAAEGLLVAGDAWSGDSRPPPACANHGGGHLDGWMEYLAGLPYGKVCEAAWRGAQAEGRNIEVESALSCSVRSRDSSLAIGDRAHALKESFTLLVRICAAQPAKLRLASLARVSREFGARTVAVKALADLCNMIFQRRQVDVAEPFLAPGERFDTVPPGTEPGKWIAAAALEEFERNCAFSSFYTGASARQRLAIIQSLGFASEEMTRRLRLVESRFGASAT